MESVLQDFTFVHTVLYLTIYSAVGWICESIFCSVIAKKPINRGFLSGPYCPIYGFGAIAILFFGEPFLEHPVLVFLVSMVAASLLEYVTSYGMEKMFHARWWDYSNNKFNLNGRVCLKNSILFGIMGIIMAYFLHPVVRDLVSMIPSLYQRVISSIIIIVVMLDSLHSVSVALHLTERLRSMEEFIAHLSASENEYKWFSPADIKGSMAKLRDIVQQGDGDPQTLEVMGEVKSMVGKHKNVSRLINAFPTFSSEQFKQSLAGLKTGLEKPFRERLAEIGETPISALLTQVREFFFPPEEAVSTEDKVYSYAKLVWIFAIASVIGYLLETAYGLIANGYLESKQGMLYGPFNQVYGMGAVIMILLLSPFARKNDRWLFFGSAILGGAFEFSVSWLQEHIFGSVSWEYSGNAFSIGGRTSLMYMVFWGILGVVFIKGIYPKLDNVVSRIPRKSCNILASIMLLFLLFDMTISALAVSRWNDRQNEIPAHNVIEEFLDENYNDAFMREVYPHMHFDPQERRERLYEKAEEIKNQ